MEEAKLTYGLVIKATPEELYELRKFIKEKNIYQIYDRISPTRILLVEPSGSTDESK